MFKDLLQHLKFVDKNHEHAVAKYITICRSDKVSEYKFFILYDFLIQFAVVAMFIGIFIQMIFEEKNIINDKTNEIAYIFFEDTDLDEINMPYSMFINSYCGW